MRRAWYYIFCCSIAMVSFQLAAQPYLDIVNTRFTISPDAGIINHKKEIISVQYFNVSTSLPVLLKNNKDALIFSPFVEKWQLRFKNNQYNYYGIIMPVSLLKQFDSTWSALATIIFRMNGYEVGQAMAAQIGGAFVINYKKQQDLTIKFGVYVNRELFGLFVIPLIGIDWRMNGKDCIFGVLPGNVTYQHLLSKKLAYGVAFRAQTNSYGVSRKSYTRVDENQLGGFLDFYLTKNIVLNAELGHSFFRQLRSGLPDPCMTGNCKAKYLDHRVNDNLYCKLSAAYRVTL